MEICVFGLMVCAPLWLIVKELEDINKNLTKMLYEEDETEEGE